MFLQGLCAELVHAVVQAVLNAAQSLRASRGDRRSCVSLYLDWLDHCFGCLHVGEGAGSVLPIKDLSVEEELAVISPLGNWFPRFSLGWQTHCPAALLPSKKCWCNCRMLSPLGFQILLWSTRTSLLHCYSNEHVCWVTAMLCFLLLCALLLKSLIPGSPLNSDCFHLAFKTPNTEILAVCVDGSGLGTGQPAEQSPPISEMVMVVSCFLCLHEKNFS